MSLTDDQKKRRVNGIGASEAAAALGVSRYATPLDIYAKKVNPQSYFNKEADHLRWGHLLEPVILDAYESVTGNKLLRSPDTKISEKYPYMFAHLDALCHVDGKVVEAKSSGLYAPKEWGPAGTDNIPMEYLIQVHHQMICMGKGVGDVADVAVLIGGNDFRIYHVPYDKGLATQIIEGLGAFWDRVETRNPPPAQTTDDLNKLFVVSNGKKIVANDEIAFASGELVGKLIKRKQLDKEIDALQFKIKQYMGDNEALEVGTYGEVVTWKMSNGAVKFDQKAFQLEHPDLYREFTKQARPVRRFIVKGTRA